MDKTPEKPAAPELTPEENARVVELRAAAAAGPLSDSDKAELDKLALAEAEAAGHPVPVTPTAAPLSAEHSLVGDILAVLEHIVATVPAVSGMGPRLQAMRMKLDGIVSPPDKK